MPKLHYKDEAGNWKYLGGPDEVAVQDSEPPEHPDLWVDVDEQPVETTPEDHGLLSGLGDDDHPQYLNNARGDALYVTKIGDSTIVGDLTVQDGSIVTGQGGGAISLKPGATADHTYMQFYARSADENTRSGFIGYASTGGNTMTVNNTLGGIDLAPKAGFGVSVPEPVGAPYAATRNYVDQRVSGLQAVGAYEAATSGWVKVPITVLADGWGAWGDIGYLDAANGYLVNNYAGTYRLTMQAWFAYAADTITQITSCTAQIAAARGIETWVWAGSQRTIIQIKAGGGGTLANTTEVMPGYAGLILWPTCLAAYTALSIEFLNNA